MRALLIIFWAVGVVGVGFCQHPITWVWLPALVGLLVGSIQAFAIPREHQWTWIGVTPVIFGVGGSVALLAALALAPTSAELVPLGNTFLSIPQLVLSWLLIAVVTGGAQRWLFLRWAPQGPRHITPVASPLQPAPVAAIDGKTVWRWTGKLLASVALALVVGIGVTIGVASQLRESAETNALGLAFALLVGAVAAVLGLVFSLIGFGIRARRSRRPTLGAS